MSEWDSWFKGFLIVIGIKVALKVVICTINYINTGEFSIGP